MQSAIFCKVSHCWWYLCSPRHSKSSGTDSQTPSRPDYAVHSHCITSTSMVGKKWFQNNSQLMALKSGLATVCLYDPMKPRDFAYPSRIWWRSPDNWSHHRRRPSWKPSWKTEVQGFTRPESWALPKDSGFNRWKWYWPSRYQLMVSSIPWSV
jgi:hypothetical protein